MNAPPSCRRGTSKVRSIRVTKHLPFVLLGILAGAAALPGQTGTPSSSTSSTPTVGPTYLSTSGARYSYYDRALTETTNLGIRLTKATTPDTPQGLWTVVSIDATPRSQASTAALRLGARYFLAAVAGGNLVVYANIAAGATTSTTTAVSSAASSATSGTVSTSLLGNLQGGMGLILRPCHMFNKNSKVNCIADLDYELNSVSSEAVKPIIGLFVGVAF